MDIRRQLGDLDRIELEEDWPPGGEGPELFVGELLEEEARERPSRWRGVKSLVHEAFETIILTLLIFLLIRVVVQNFRIEGSSMEPNLHAGQYLIINKFAYRWLHPPQRGDIIVFEYPRAPNRDFIKRVIGLPGEKVEIRQGRVYINDQPLEEPYLSRLGTYSWGPQVVGEDEYFVLGDNRNNSSDSHTWGMLPKGNIVGKAWISYWPPQYWGLVPNSNYSFASSE
ncbi:MAG: signal peptidase I [Anaerolineae bacterium]